LRDPFVTGPGLPARRPVLEILFSYPFPNDLIAVFFSFMFLWQFGYVHGTQW
jgi:hypothetical protein